MNEAQALSDLRDECERTKVEIAQLASADRVLVVLRRFKYYYCHRYFKVGDEWVVSVDGKTGNPEVVMKWLCEPKAIKEGEK